LAIIGFVEVITQLGKKLGALVWNTAGMKEFGEVAKATTEELVKLMEATDRYNKQATEAGVSSQQKWAMELEAATKAAKDEDEAIRLLSDQIYALKNGMRAEIGGKTAADLPTMEKDLARRQGNYAMLTARTAAAQAELNVAMRAGAEEFESAQAAADKLARSELLAALKDENAEAEKLWKTWNALNDEIEKGVAALDTDALKNFAKRMQQGRAPLVPYEQADFKRQSDMGAWYNATRTYAEKFAIEVEKLNQLFGKDDPETYRRALRKITEQYSDSYLAAHQFGEAMGEALKQGMLMGRSWMT
jgi:thermostable 8-oxoguanine DNA glycosylase